jgi:hypothetical protein
MIFISFTLAINRDWPGRQWKNGAHSGKDLEILQRMMAGEDTIEPKK